MIQPCCLISHRNGCRLIAIIDMIGSAFGMMTGILILVAILFFKDELMSELLKDERLHRDYELKEFLGQPAGLQYTLVGFTIFICVVELVIAQILLKGARTQNPMKCFLWFKIHCGLFVIGILFTILAIITSNEKVLITIIGLLGLAYQAYSLWVVRSYVTELNSGRSSALRCSKDKDLDKEQEQPLQDMQKS